MAAEHRRLAVSRRQFVQGASVAGLGLVAACGRLAEPSPSGSLHRIAYLRGVPPSAANTGLVTAFRQGMADLGYLEGRNLLLEERDAAGIDQLAGPVAELLRLPPEVIVVSSTPVARALRGATTTVPIVNAGSGDLVATGLATSHARPGGNVTGLSTPPLFAKQLQLLQDAVPTVSKIAVLFDTTSSAIDIERESLETAVRTLGLQLQLVGITFVRDDLDLVFDTPISEHAEGLFVAQGAGVAAHHARIAELAIRSRLPSMWQQSEAVGSGGLMAYGPNRASLYRRAAYYVDRILKGTNPADLPVEEPREFDFLINLRTAQALGLTIPPHVLLQATEVLQ